MTGNITTRIKCRIKQARIGLIRAIEKNAELSTIESAVGKLKTLKEARAILRDRNAVVDALSIFLIATCALIFASNLHVRSAPLSMLLESHAVNFTTDSVESEEITLTNASLSRSSAASIGMDLVDVTHAERVTISGLAVSKGTLLTVQISKSCLTLSVTAGTLRGDVFVDSNVGEVAMPFGSKAYPLMLNTHSRSASFNICGQLVSPVNITFRPSHISFFERVSVGLQSNLVLPVIVSGRVSVGDESFTPSKYDILQASFDQQLPRSAYVTVDTAMLRTGITASAIAVSLGLNGHESTLMPTLLRYLSTDHTWKIVYSSIVLLVGVAWKIRSLFVV